MNNNKIIKEYDDKGNMIHYKDSNGYEYWNEYNENNNMIHHKTSNGYEYWREYNDKGNEIHYKDSNGYEYWKDYDENNMNIKEAFNEVKLGKRISNNSLKNNNTTFLYLRGGNLQDNEGYIYTSKGKNIINNPSLKEGWTSEEPDRDMIIKVTKNSLSLTFTVLNRIDETSIYSYTFIEEVSNTKKKLKGSKEQLDSIFLSKTLYGGYLFLDEIKEEYRKLVLSNIKEIHNGEY